mgnify:CR=1 FL=1
MPPRRATDIDEIAVEGQPGDGASVDAGELMVVSEALAVLLRQQLGLAQDGALPMLDDFLSQCGVLGAAPDLQWLVAVCCRPGETRAHLNLGRIRHHIQQLKNEADTGMAKILELGRAAKQAHEAEVSIDQAGELFYQHCYPDVQECLDIAVEQLQQPRWRIMLAALGHYKDELHGVAVTNAVENDDMVVQAPHSSRQSSSGTSLVFLQRHCPVCQSVFQPEKDKPKQLYCRQACGDFAYATQTWANNATNYPDMRTLPYPDPYGHGVPLEKRAAALAWQEREALVMLSQAEQHSGDLRMRGR